MANIFLILGLVGLIMFISCCLNIICIGKSIETIKKIDEQIKELDED